MAAVGRQSEMLHPGEPPEKARPDEYYEVLDKEKAARERKQKDKERKKVSCLHSRPLNPCPAPAPLSAPPVR